MQAREPEQERGKRKMLADIKRLEEFKAANPTSSLVPAIEHRIEWLQRKLKDFTKS